ncbi:hypothetical protein [Pseudomonas phage LUZ7]|uniref:Uncharacterized protein n=1 Tax=Pseudomonas phage LUZ7 TaxID=655097 RepID=C8ZKJ3_9CAUD|nr:hypothetical protein PP-LUZ7_gp094 [Pseudomonas phage LUZ7]CAZ66235.1 hypothetical protein [Pseudomonas phage LUZ7]
MNTDLNPELLKGVFTRVLVRKYSKEDCNKKAMLLSRKIAQEIWPNFVKRDWDHHLVVVRGIV